MKIDYAIPNFTINEILHQSSSTVVYRGFDVRNNPVVIKSLNSLDAGHAKKAKLINEFDILKHGAVEGVSRVIDLLGAERIPALVMEDFGGRALSSYTNEKKIDLAEFLVIAIKIAEILGRIHAGNLVHKNINPDNIVINPSSGEIRIIDFGLATRLSREHPASRNPYVLEGSLAYMSPEQTGRMNRSTDHRTDIYSLGITFYELLTGRLPFQSEDALELVHCHIARKMIPASSLLPSIPQVLSDIIAKLTEKIAEERYQSALGVKYDLEHCLRSLQENAVVSYFTIALNDIFTRFKVSEKLYGRDREVDTLLHAYEEVARGGFRLILVTGTAGVGKTAVINEIHKPTINKKGYFVAGKCDQFQANIPFFVFRQAFSELLKYLISEPRNRLDTISADLKEALGLNMSILTSLVPEFELITGKQTLPHELNPAEAQHRLFFTLIQFIRVFATAGHPLTIFLDDLQWTDDASVSLIRELATTEIPYLFIIGAYRNNELTGGHPLALALADLQKTVAVHEMALGPLDEANVNQLLADALMAKPAETVELSAVIYKKTTGNPFYINELLRTIYQENLISFNFSANKWTWDTARISGLDISENIVQFITGRLKELPADCMDMLQLAACIGNSFKLKLLSRITGKTASAITHILWPAVEREIISPLSEDYRLVINDFDFNVSYKFLHDRIQQATYSLVEEQRRKEMNLSIGRVILKTASAAEKNEQLVELVRYCDEGRSLITDPAEKLELAEMNLQAGRKAQDAIAYQSAVNYFKTGIELLPAAPWESHYRTAFDLYRGYAQNAYLINDYTAAEECIGLLLLKAKTKLEKVDVLSLRLRQYNTIGKAEESIRAGIEGLALLGYPIPENPGPFSMLRELLLARLLLGNRKPARLVDSPNLEDPEKKAAAKLFTDLSPSAFILGRDNLFGLVQLKIVNLSLRYGNCPESAYAFITFGTVLAELFGNLAAAESFGRLGLAINEKLNDPEYKCRVIAAYGVLTHHFNNHWKTTGEWFKKGIEAGYHSGDLFFLAHCAVNCTVWNPAADLGSSLADQLKFLQVAKSTNYKDAYDTALMNLQVTKAFMGLTADQLSMNDPGFNELDCLEQMSARKYRSGIGMYHIHKAEILLFYQQCEQACDEVTRAEKFTRSLLSLVYLTRLCIVSFFAAAGYRHTTGNEADKTAAKRMQRSLRKMTKWAKHNPVNFGHWKLLMEAEMKQSPADLHQTAALYDKAIQAARENGWLADEAFANELAALYYQRQGVKAFTTYWQAAYERYRQWGASGKIKFLDNKYPGIFTPDAAVPRQAPAAVMPDRDEGSALDVATIVQSSQAISGEIELKSLLSKMMQIILVNAGAGKGMLLLAEDDVLFIRASAEEAETIAMLDIPVKSSSRLPQSIINYVSNLKEPVVLDNASAGGEFGNDAYIERYRPKSILCSPILFLNKLYGIIYLENNLSVGAFTEERLKIVNLLSAQMAISIQNALLFSSLEQKVENRTVELRLEKKKSDDLLSNILPDEVAGELKLNGFAEARQFDQTTVLFSDFVNFTRISEQMTPRQLVSELNLYFTEFDKITERCGLEKIKTIGDSYMAVAGLPNADKDHALHAANAAVEIAAFVAQKRSEGSLFEIRIGLNSGSVVAGIVGTRKFAYDIWGDTVNTASRMESNSEPGKINISASTHTLLQPYFHCRYRGTIMAKNKGMIDMYFMVEKKAPADLVSS